MPELTVCPDVGIDLSEENTIISSPSVNNAHRQVDNKSVPLRSYSLTWKNLIKSEAQSIGDLFDAVGLHGVFDANFSSGGLPSGKYRFSSNIQITAQSPNHYDAQATIKEARGVS